MEFVEISLELDIVIGVTANLAFMQMCSKSNCRISNIKHGHLNNVSNCIFKLKGKHFKN